VIDDFEPARVFDAEAAPSKTVDTESVPWSEWSSLLLVIGKWRCILCVVVVVVQCGVSDFSRVADELLTAH
jgi:hypothetical protein